MKKQKSENKRFKRNINILIIVFIIFFFFVAIISYSYEKTRLENLQLKNDRADAFCKSQSYEKVSEKTTMQEYENKSCFIEYEWRKNKSGMFEAVDSELMKKPLENLTSDEALELLISFPLWQNYHKIECPYYTKTETRNFEVGYYNQTDNSYYCLAEICYLYVEGYNPNNPLVECFNEFYNYNNKNYQKSEKFPYK